MLIDIEDGEPRSYETTPEIPEAMAQISLYQACREANIQLSESIRGSLNESTEQLMQTIFAFQATFFSSIMRSARFELWTDVMTLERLRTRVLVQCHASQDAFAV